VSTVPCLIVSTRREDLEFGAYLTQAHHMPMHALTHAGSIRTFLVDHPGALCFIDADNRQVAEPVLHLLNEFSSPNRVFVMSTRTLGEYLYLFKYPSFCHHIHRRYLAPAPEMYARLLESSLLSYPFGIDRFLPSECSVQKITLRKSQQKLAAVEALQNVFNKSDVNSRLASLGAQAADELIMNALFDAPVQADGERYRRQIDRAAEFELTDREQVEIHVGTTEQVVGVCVRDHFGSLQKDIVLGFLRKDYSGEKYQLRQNETGAGLGLHGCIQSGLSMLFVCKPGVRTEVMLFFPRKATYREFREGFRFLSVMSE
jgi:hypothetical protein